ncbi:MAG: hypothetical protein HPY61_12130 [Methanotrichaceae archaeon]|nr:hypothetical protein [Methanotrichaceae archaeon]
MQSTKGAIVEASVQKISAIFPKKPPGLRFNETDALIVKAKTPEGLNASATFYFSLKPDGSFDENAMGSRVVQGRRHKLASFLRYYRIADNIKEFKFNECSSELMGREVEIVSDGGDAAIYVP